MGEYRDIISKYKKQLEQELHGAVSHPETAPDIEYSRAYSLFKKEQVSGLHSFYERACNWTGKFLKVKVNPKDAEKVAPYLKLTHLDVTVEGVYAFTYLTAILVIFLSVIGFLLTFSFIALMGGIILGLVALLGLPAFPKQMFNSWRAKASDQLVMAVLYLIIYMEHTPNLEQAVRFVSEHMPPPISLDFMKVLWDVETKKFASIKESLDNYVETWKDWDNEFVESIQLVESSLLEPDPERKKEVFEKAVQVTLDGTQDHMINYAHSLQSPIQTLHMLGIVLPVMGMVMLPMIGAFMGESINVWALFGLYNVFLPIIVYVIGKQVLTTRPAGTNTEDAYLFIRQKYRKGEFKIGKTTLRLPPSLMGLMTFILIGLPALFYLPRGLFLENEAYRDFIYSSLTMYMSIDLIAAIGLSLGVYYWWSVRDLIPLKRSITGMEREFASATFQLGNRLEEKIPAEIAISRVAATMAKSDVAKMFQLIDYNMKEQGASLREAIYNKKYGALVYYPSTLIKSVMDVLIEGVKKGPEIVGKSLLTISKYLRSVHKVEERLKDLLADTVSSMTMQVKMFVPLIAGIVVGLASLTTVIMLNLGTRLGGIETAGGAGGVGAGLLDVFQIESMIPPFAFQSIVGLYVIQLIILLSFLLNGVVNGHDTIEEQYMMAQNLFIATLFYVVITLVTTLLFGNLAGPLTAIEYG